MSQKSSTAAAKAPADRVVRDIRRATRKHHSAEDKIRVVLEGLRGEESIAGDTARAATTVELQALRHEARTLKEVVAEQALELRLMKKSMTAAGDDRE